MDELECCFERFVDQMSKVILNLLGSLDVDELVGDICQEVHIFICYLLASVYPLHFQTHIATHSSNTRVLFHVLVHFQKRHSLRLEAHIQKNRKLRFKFLTEAVEKPIVRRQLSSIFVLDAQEKIHYGRRPLSIPFVSFIS